MNKIKNRIEDLDKTVACYMGKVEKLEKSQREFDKETKDYIRKMRVGIYAKLGKLRSSKYNY